MADTPFGSPPPRRLPDLSSTAQGSPLPAALPAALPPVPKELVRLPLLPRAASSELKLLPAIPKSPPISRGAPVLSGVNLAVIAQDVANRKEERGAGLLRRLSIDWDWRGRIESELDSLLTSRSPVVVEAYTSILGLRNEGRLGYAYDDLGVFPVFVDTLGREYFFAKSIREPREFYVRIPRGQTRRQNKTAYTTAEEAPFTQLPAQREELILQALRLPFFPLRYLPSAKDVDAGSPPSAEVVTTPIYGTVSAVHSEMDASCHITLSRVEDPQGCVGVITAARAAYSRTVRDFIVALCKDLPPQAVLEVSEYLQHIWAPMAREWVKVGKK